MSVAPEAASGAPRSVSISAALGAGTFAAVAAGLPALPRATELGAAPVAAALILIGGSSLFLGPTLALAGAVPTLSRRLRAALIGLALSAAPLAGFATLLKLKTHHRPLGAATFAVLALVIVGSLLLVSTRVLAASENPARLGARIARATLLVLAALSLSVTLYRSLAAPDLLVHVLDGLRAFATLAFAHLALRRVVPHHRLAASFGRAGLLLWAALIVAGAVALTTPSGALTRRAAPILSGPAAWL